jgi:glycosyltransferase involved in cell wall biosynthesis
VTTRRQQLTILSVAHDIGDRRLHRLAFVARSRGYEVSLVGVGDLIRAPDGVQTSTVPNSSSKLRRLGRAVALPLRRRHGTLVVVDPDLIACGLVARLARRVDLLIIDVHEDFAAVARDRSWIPTWARGAISAIARTATGAARFADVTVVADDHVPPLSARRRVVVDNRPLRSPSGPTTRRPRSCVYVGDLRDSRGLWQMIDAVRQAPGWSLDLVGPMSDPSDRQRVIAAIGDDNRIRLHGRLPPGEATEVMRTCEVGMVLLANTPAYREATPSKLYEYFDAGLAVIGTPLPKVADLIAESGAGRVAEDGAGASRVLNEWADNPDELDNHRRAARSWADANLDDRDGFECLFDVIDQAASEIRRSGRK